MTTTPASAANGRALADCPFCGGTASAQRFGGARTSYCVWCDTCSISTAWMPDRDDAIAAWNRRAIPQPAAEFGRPVGGAEHAPKTAETRMDASFHAGAGVASSGSLQPAVESDVTLPGEFTNAEDLFAAMGVGPAAEPSPLEAPQVWSKEADMVASWERGASGEPVAWAVTAPKGGIEKAMNTSEAAAQLARYMEGIDHAKRHVRPLIFGDAAPDCAPSATPTVIIREPTNEERHEEGRAKLMASADRFNSDRAPSAGSAADALDAARYKVEKLSGSEYARVIDTKHGATVKKYNIFKGDGWAAATKHADRLNSQAIAAMPKEPT